MVGSTKRSVEKEHSEKQREDRQQKRKTLVTQVNMPYIEKDAAVKAVRVKYDE